jgi:hypothetical protein
MDSIAVRLPICDGIDPLREVIMIDTSLIAVRLPICGGIDPVRGLKMRLRDVIAVRLPICDGIDPVRHMEECRKELKSKLKCSSTVPIHTVVQFYHA